MLAETDEKEHLVIAGICVAAIAAKMVTLVENVMTRRETPWTAHATIVADPATRPRIASRRGPLQKWLNLNRSSLLSVWLTRAATRR